MAIAFRQKAESGPAVAANITISKPTGTVDNDIMIAGVAVEDDVAITAPAGWNSIGSVDHTGQPFDLYVYWKRASSEGASYQWTHSSAGRSGFIASYSGCITSGDPQDATATTNQGTGTSLTATGLTTATANSMLIFVGGLWLWSRTVTPPASFNERVDNTNTYLADLVQAAAGASGNKTATISGSDDWIGFLIALKEETAVVTTNYLTLLGVGT